MSNAVHCWKDYREHIEEVYGYGSNEWVDTFSGEGATCLLADGHEGQHEWTPDGKIVLQFNEPNPEARGA